MENPPQYTKNIPDEIIADIFSRLPAKCIGRFRCVSKPWNSYLLQRQFIKTHLNRIKNFPNEQHQSFILVNEHSTCLFLTHLENAHQVFDEMPATAFATKLNFDDHKFYFGEVICSTASCDGLILVQGSSGWNDKLLLVNPTTREVREVPPRAPTPYAQYHPCCTTVYGLGYDSVSDDYKVVTVSYNGSKDKHDCTDMFVDVYSLRNGAWKRADNFLYDHAIEGGSSGVFVDGYIHWVATRNSDDSTVILAFHLAEEKFSQVPTPSYVHDGLVALGGCLCMFPKCNWASNCETDVWVMKQYGVKESWTKYTIFYTKVCGFIPICTLGKEQLVLLKESRDVKLMVCKMEDGIFKDIIVHGIPDDFCVAANCLQSLVSPHYTN